MDKFIKSPIKSLRVFDAKAPCGKTAKMDGRPFHSLTYRKAGNVKINVDNKSFFSSSDCITYMPKKTPYSQRIIQDTHIIAIHFDCIFETETTEAFVVKNNNPQLYKLFCMVLDSYFEGDNSNYECYSHFYNLLAQIEKLLMKDQKDKEGKGITEILEAKLKIEQNFTNNDFNIDALIREMSISASYLRKEFKKAYSLTPIEYLMLIRQQKAMSMLASDYYSVDKIAKDCGYSSASYFIQSFRKSTGYSPVKYKEKFLIKY